MTTTPQDDAQSQPGEVRSSAQLGLVPEACGVVQSLSIAGTPMPNSTGVDWLRPVGAGTKLYAQAALDAAVAAERERWQKAWTATGFLIDPLRPAGAPGSYARGFDVGVETALRTLRDNLRPNV